MMQSYRGRACAYNFMRYIAVWLAVCTDSCWLVCRWSNETEWTHVYLWQ